ncbi:hypothetical protein SUGI_0335400 [Cryptomeria japonica]|uniref:uncharacterized protein LOC131036775 n=1 Tax=Cryptomeria japonica TaxID=3369 RepID=UPI002408DDC0|nr:uncharacterized protein LOC131036775 [Cryptomeria japonica]GLJ18785.1 hypothetical protein SUGI_0335400 [Cryptomeria japonica]
MCRYHAVPAKVPSNPRKAELNLPQGHPSSSYPHPHFHPRKSTQIHNLHDDSPTMEPPPATANPPNTNTHHRIDAFSFTDWSFLQEEDDDDDEDDRGNKEWVDDCGSDNECSSPQHPVLFPGEQLCHILQGVCSCRTQLEAALLRDVREALRILGLSAQEEDHSSLRRNVMNNLRRAGYNAGICKSRWEQTNGYPAGDYEFIDVILGAKSNDRLLVDIDFRAQFEIARPTAEYAALVEVLPTLLVGSVDKLRDIIWIMCDAAKRSLKARGLHLPPWRKKRYIEAKWLASHKRTTSHDPHQQHLLLTQWNACFLHHNNLRSTGRISGLGRALAQAVTHNNTNDVY